MVTSYRFKDGDLRDLVQKYAAEHNHDGTNSTAVSVGTVSLPPPGQI